MILVVRGFIRNATLFGVCVLGLFSCMRLDNARTYYFKIQGFTQGTSYHVTYSSRDSINIQPMVDSVLASFDKSLSTYDSLSLISAFNQPGSGVEVDEKLAVCFNKAREVYHRTNGAFDITIAPVVNYWGFGFTAHAENFHVDSAIIDSLLQFVGMDKVELEAGRLVKKDPRLMLDVNAIAQGYAVDVVCDFLGDMGTKNYLVEIGGEVRAKGKNARGEFWRVGIDKPVEGNYIPGQNLQAVMSLKNQSLATSGNYRKFIEKDGVKYAHSIDPKTGFPSRHQLLSATILAPDCITADAYATACMVLGLEKAKQLVEQIDDIEAYLIYNDKNGKFQTFSTPGLLSRIEAY